MSSPENPKLKAMLYVCGCASARVHVNVGILFVQSLSIARATLSGECPRVDEHGAQLAEGWNDEQQSGMTLS